MYVYMISMAYRLFQGEVGQEETMILLTTLPLLDMLVLFKNNLHAHVYNLMLPISILSSKDGEKDDVFDDDIDPLRSSILRFDNFFYAGAAKCPCCGGFVKSCKTLACQTLNNGT